MPKSCFPLLTGILVAFGNLCGQESDPQLAPYTPLTFTETYLYSMGQVFTVPRVFQVAAHAAIDAASLLFLKFLYTC
jgi:hypothetical protein